ncbi:tyrosyl-tRNA synthetase [Lishizhenia tianjinensis]|uniref:Tyrosine--tRNA ligase n=1 Tax=Lishizhenia tianjinensis TaxID=477690 RepID=A0A1I7A021_9FLAO|nr:tyrosine--tRNA ligase [Lishizhenia tianjinensis]SFT68254.1 tyrosyl-tRNA synthetase [Lishizhenia tianjinensis]
MPTNFIKDELEWRGMVQDIMPGTQEQLEKEMTTGYVGFDPTADSLHVGNLLPITLLMHLQRAGHRPIALVGGATGMVGDPSGKSDERNLLDEATLAKNIAGQTAQLKKFLDFDTNAENAALLVNNYDWMKEFSFIEFIRDVGKHITINYMSSKDSVKKRVETGLSFTEFSYQLIQGHDFVHLNKTYNCMLQMGGSDQWGNITTGTELMRRMLGKSAFAFTCPLLTKADGGKFGKTESGTIWLDPEKTTPYQFYQFWLNATDEDAKKLIRFYTFKTREEIEALEAAHNEAPHKRILQNAIADELTTRVHSAEDLVVAKAATKILFGKSSEEDLRSLDEKAFLAVFDGIPSATVSRDIVKEGLSIVNALGSETNFLKSNGEARRELKGNAIAVNKAKVQEDFVITEEQLINDKYVLLGKGKKNNYLLIVE